MGNLKDLLKELISDDLAIDFYLNYTTYGLFFFKKEECNKAQADKKLLSFLNLEYSQSSFSPSQYLNESSEVLIYKLSALTGQEITNQGSFLLTWNVNGTKYQTTCNAYWLKSEDIIFIGLRELDKLSDKPREPQRISKTGDTEITDYEQTDKSLEEHTEHYQTVVSALNEGFVFQSADGTIIASNYNAEKILGLSKDQISGQTRPDPRWHITQQDGSPFTGKSHPVILTLKDGKPRQGVIMGVHKPDASLTWISVNTEPLFHEGETLPHAVMVSFADITEKRNTENQLQLEKQRLENIIDGVKLGTWEWNVSTHLFEYNTHYAEMLGYTVNEVSPGTLEKWKSMVHPEDLPEAEKAFQAHLNGESDTYAEEFRMKHKEGHWVWVLSMGKIITRDHAGLPMLMAGTGVDISSRKKQEAELRLFESVIKNTKDGVLIAEAEPFNLPGPQIIFVNKAFCEMTGYSPEELITQTPRILQGAKTDRKLLDRVRTSLENWESFEYDLINYRKNGEEFWVNMSVTPMADETGWFTHWIAIERDVTEKKKQEEELRLFESVIKNTKDAVLITEPQPTDSFGRKIVFVNRAFCEMTGYRPEELIGQTPKILQGDKTDRATLDKIRTSLENQKPYEFDLVNYKKNGEEFWVNMSITPLADEKGEVTHWISLGRDITENKKAEAKLTASEKQYRQLVDNSNDIIYSITSEGIFTFASVAWTKLLGHTPEEVVGRSFTDFVHSDDIPLCAVFLKKVLDTGERQEGVEYRVKHKEGHWVWHTSSATPIKDSTGKFMTGFDGLARDITESKKMQLQIFEAKERAEESEQRLKMAVKSAQLGIWEWNSKDTAFIWDDKIYDLLGYRKETDESTLDLWKSGLHPEDKDRVIKEFEDALEQGTEYNTVYKIVKPDGRELHLDVHGLVIRDEDNRTVRMIGVLHDVTDEKNKEIELLKAERDKAEESERRLKMATDSAQLGIWDWDMEADKVIWDEKSYELLGLEKGVANPGFETWSGVIHPDDLPNAIADLEDALNGKKAYNSTYRVIHPDGKEKYINGYGIVQRNSEGNPDRVIGVQRDITEEKLGEIQLKRAKEKAEAASMAKSEFLAIMSHEIRTPLNSVIGFSELLLQTGLNDLQEDYTKSVNYSANTLLDLINDILDFSKIEAGKLELEPERIDLYALLFLIIEIVKFKLKEKQIELLLYIAPDVPKFVVADALRVKQVLVNLMGNAVKFTESGEIELSVTTLKQSKNGKQTSLRFGVRDTGIGISEAQQEKIFEAFSQEDTSVTRKYGGTGLGLSISNRLLLLMESTLQLESEQGKGSFFYFDINLESEPKSPVKQHRFEGINRVLLIDDNARSLEIIKSLFSGSGIEVETANNGFYGLQKLQSDRQSYDVVLLDHEMPLFNGEEVVKKIKEVLPPDVKQPSVFMIFDFLSKQSCKVLKEKYSIKYCLQKPVTGKELLKGLSSLKSRTEETSVTRTLISEHPSEMSFNGESILVVDDNSMNRKLANSMLSKLFKDIEVVQAENGERALELVKSRPFRMILMDVQMPGMSGYETTGRIREILEGKNRTIIIALTAGTIKGEKERCIAAGMDDYMSKPVTLGKLRKIIKKWSDEDEGWKNGVFYHDLSDLDRLDFNYKTFLRELENDVETAEEVLDAVREGGLEEKVAELNDVFKKQGKEKELRSLAHRIRGICLSLYFEKLEERVSQLENLYPHYRSKEADLLLKQINEKYKAVEKIISEREYLQD